jgi:hydrocephalus-inducing protein
VARRVSVEPLDSSFFKVQRQPVSKQVEGSKIAAGMEAVFRITFTPDSTGSFEQQLVVATERERFLVPVLAVGAAEVLDVPDSIDLPAAAAKKTSKHSFLVRNVGRAAGSFQLSTSSSCFAVKPDQGELAPGEALQLTVEFTPLALGPHEGELEVLYSGFSRASFTVLRGMGQQLDVGLSTGQQGLQLPKAQMGKLSQRSFTIFNRSSSDVKWGIHQQLSA